MTYVIKYEKRIIMKPKKENKYCNIVSKKDSIIQQINTYKGQNMVETGDFVKKGEILISGDITFNNETKSSVCADGKVYGNTWYNINIKYPVYRYKKIYTGKKSYNLLIENKNQNHYVFNIHFKNYKNKRKVFLKFKGFKIYLVKHREYTLEKYRLSKKEILRKAFLTSKKNLLTKIGNDIRIIDKKVLQCNQYNSIMDITIFYSINELVSSQEIKNDYKKE